MAAECHKAGSHKHGSHSVTPDRRYRISLDGGGQQVELVDYGEGSPVLYLHGLLRRDDDPLLNELAKRHRIVAPLIPGYGASTGGENLADMHDAVIYYLEILDTLSLRDLPLIGHSLGGMFAAELAAASPERFSHVVLLAPFGLWDDSAPTFDFFARCRKSWPGRSTPTSIRKKRGRWQRPRRRPRPRSTRTRSRAARLSNIWWNGRKR